MRGTIFLLGKPSARTDVPQLTDNGCSAGADRRTADGPAPPCCIDRLIEGFGGDETGARPLHYAGATPLAVQSECRSVLSHPEAAAPGNQLGRVRCRPARSR